MAVVRISDLASAPVALNGTEPVEIEQGGVSYKTTAQAIANLGGGGGGGGGGGIAWSVVTAGQTLAANQALLAVITTTQNFPLPATPSAGNVFIVANALGSTAGALARIQTGSTQQVVDAPVGDDITLEPGETIYLVARSSTLLEIV